MIFVVALPHAIRYIRDCADLQGDSRRVRAVKRRRRASRRRPPIGGSRPQGAALITRPCNTVSLYCTRLESTLPCIADSDLYTLYTRLRLPPRATDLYLLRVRFGRTPTLRSIVLAERPRTLHRPTGCKPTTMTTGNGIPSRAFARSFVRSGTAGEKKKSRGRIPPRDLVDFRRRSNSVSLARSVARVSRSGKAARNHRRRKTEGETLVSRNLRRRRLRWFASRL